MKNTRRTFAIALTGFLAALGLHASADAFPEGSPKFETDYAKAQEEAKKSGKPMLLVFSATWCGPCQENKKKVYPSAEVKEYHDKFVWAYLDADVPANEKLMQQFKVEGIPHIQFTTKDGKAVDNMVGQTTPEDFVKVLKKALEKASK